MKLSDVEKKVQEWQAQHDEAIQKHRNLMQEINSLQAEMQQAVEAEDSKKYLAAKHRVDELEFEIRVQKKRSEKPLSLSQDEISEAWKNYAEEFKQEKDKLGKKVQEDLARLSKDLQEISFLQRQAYEKRNRICQLAGTDDSRKKNAYPLQLWQAPKILLRSGRELFGIACLGLTDQEANICMQGFSLTE